MTKFLKSVELCSRDGELLCRVHGEEAQRMVEYGEAKRDSSARIIVLRSTFGHKVKPPTKLTLNHYKGKPLEFKQKLQEPDENGIPITVATVATLRKISSIDRWAYRLSVTDCMRAGA